MPVDTSQMWPGIGKRIREEEDLRALKHQQALENLRTELAIKQEEARQKTASQLSAAEKEQEFLLQQKKLEADRNRALQDQQFTEGLIQRARAQDYGSELNPITGQIYTPNEAFAHAGMDMQKARLPNLYGQLDTGERAKIGLETSGVRGRDEAANAIAELSTKRAELQQKKSEAVLAKLIAEGGQPTAEALARIKGNSELARQQGLGASAGQQGITEGQRKIAVNEAVTKDPSMAISGVPAALASVITGSQRTDAAAPKTAEEIRLLKAKADEKEAQNAILKNAGGALGFGPKDQSSTTGAVPKYNPMLYGTNTPARPPSPSIDFGTNAAPQASTVAGPQNREYGPQGPVQVSYGSAAPQGVLDPATKNILLQNILFNAGHRRNINSNLFEQ